MRIRTIKPEFFTHEGIYEAEREARMPLRLIFIGLWCAADREGRFKWEPRRLKTMILPYDSTDFDKAMTCLNEKGFLVRYGDGRYGLIPSFLRHQHINAREAKSSIPSLDEFVECAHVQADMQRTCMHVTGEVNAHGEGKGKEGNREGKELARVKARAGSKNEVLDFIKEVGLYPRDAEYAWNHWESNGWKIKGEPIKDWKAAVRKWKEGRFFPTQKECTPEDFWPVEVNDTPEPQEIDRMDLFNANQAKRLAEEAAQAVMTKEEQEAAELAWN